VYVLFSVLLVPSANAQTLSANPLLLVSCSLTCISQTQTAETVDYQVREACMEAVRPRVSVLRIFYSTLASSEHSCSYMASARLHGGTQQGLSIVHTSVQSLLCSPSTVDQTALSRTGHRRVTCIGGWGGIPVPLTGGGGCLISGSLSPVAASSSSSPSLSCRQYAQHRQLHGLSMNAWPA
jgi:hypothetical protein